MNINFITALYAIHFYDHNGMIVMLISTSEMLSGRLLSGSALLLIYIGRVSNLRFVHVPCLQAVRSNTT